MISRATGRRSASRRRSSEGVAPSRLGRVRGGEFVHAGPGFECASLGLGWAAGAGWAAWEQRALLDALTAFVFELSGWGEIVEPVWDEGGAYAFFEDSLDADKPPQPWKLKVDFIAKANDPRRFGRTPRNAHPPHSARLGGQSARFEEPHGPEPLVESHRIRVRHILSIAPPTTSRQAPRCFNSQAK
jgi:hypothetical protein